DLSPVPEPGIGEVLSGLDEEEVHGSGMWGLFASVLGWLPAVLVGVLRVLGRPLARRREPLRLSPHPDTPSVRRRDPKRERILVTLRCDVGTELGALERAHDGALTIECELEAHETMTLTWRYA